MGSQESAGYAGFDSHRDRGVPMTRLTVSFACNDRHGRFRHDFEALEVYDDEDHCLSLTCTGLHGPKLSFAKHESVAVGIYRYRCTNHKSHEGNLIWDACEMLQGDVELLVRQLHALEWEPEEWSDTTMGPLIQELWPRVFDELLEAIRDGEMSHTIEPKLHCAWCGTKLKSDSAPIDNETVVINIDPCGKCFPRDWVKISDRPIPDDLCILIRATNGHRALTYSGCGPFPEGFDWIEWMVCP
jgi:hypothetical protein